MKFTLIFALVYFICVQAAPARKSNSETQESKKEVDELELELKELQKKISKLKDKIEAKPTAGSTTGINPIEKIRQQSINEELELEGNQIKHSAKKEAEATSDKKKNVTEGELERELEGETAEKHSYPTRLTTQEKPTAKPIKVSTTVTNKLSEIRTKTENPDLHLISIKKIQQQKADEELDLNNKLTEKIKPSEEIKPATASHEKTTMKEEENLQDELEKATKLTTLGRIYVTPKPGEISVPATAQPTEGTIKTKISDFRLISIKKIRHQKINEELDLKNKSPEMLKHPAEDEPKRTANKKTTIGEEKKLEHELEKETKLIAKEMATVKPNKVSTSDTEQPTTISKDPDTRHIVTEKVKQQQNVDEELELEGQQLSHKIKHPDVIKLTPTPIKQKEKLPQRIGHSTKKPAQEKTIAPRSTAKKVLKETLKHSIQTQKLPSEKIISKELEQERLLEGENEKKPKLKSEKLKEEENNIRIVKIEKIGPSTSSLQFKTEGPVTSTIPLGQETRHTVSPQVPEQNIRPTTHKVKKITTTKQETPKEPLHKTHKKTPTQMAVTKKSPKNIAELEEELEQQLKNDKPGKVARVKKSEVEEDLEKDLKEIALSI